MKNRIKKIGGIQKLDENGFIINDFNVQNIQADYQCVLDDVLQLCIEKFNESIHSIYLRGSVLKGQAINGISDIDLVIVTNGPFIENLTNTVFEIRHSINDKYNFLNGVEMFTVDLMQFQNSNNLQFLLKTQSKCVYGIDLRYSLPNFKIGKICCPHSLSLAKDISKAKNRLSNETDIVKNKNTCAWIMKRIVRVGFEIVIEKEQFFTRDLYYCYESFIKYHPNKSKEMYLALELAVFPIAEKDEIFDIIDYLEKYLIVQINL